jgi:microcystin-dependent protein
MMFDSVMPDFDLTTITGKQEFRKWFTGVVRNEIRSYTPEALGVSTTIGNDINRVETTINNFGSVPTGCVMPYAANQIPDSWYLCDGRSWGTLGWTSGNALYDLLSPLGWSGLPNLKGRTVLGVDTANSYDLTESGGGNTTLNINQIPQHSHTINHGHSVTSTQGAYMLPGNAPGAFLMGNGNGWNVGAAPLAFYINDYNGSSGFAGQATPNSVPTTPPYIVLNYIIKG